MYTIIYVSTCDPNLSSSDRKSLFETSKDNSDQKGVTGIFIYSDGNFFQILEGDKAILKSIYHKIEADSRHYNNIKLADKEVKNSFFQDYKNFFTVIQDKSNITDVYNFLQREKEYNPAAYESIAYQVQKFMPLI